MDVRHHQENVKTALFWPFTVIINCSNDLKNFANLKNISWSLKSVHFQNNCCAQSSVDSVWWSFSWFSGWTNRFLHSRSEQFWKQNTNEMLQNKEVTTNETCKSSDMGNEVLYSTHYYG